LLLASAAVVAGAVVVGPLLSHVVLRWIAWRGVVPLLLGWDPLRSEIGSSRPMCRACGAALAPAGLPVLPWLVVRGRCRHCGEPVGRWVLGVELATGLGFGLVTARFGWSVQLLPLLFFVAGLVAASAVDLICGRIPTRFVYVTGVGLVATMTLAALVDGELSSLAGAAIGSTTYLAVLGLQYVVSRGRMGLGDVRLGVVVGLVTGWLGWLSWLEWGREHLSDGETDAVLLTFGAWGATLLSLVVAGLAASIDGLVRRVVKGHRQPYPFGPWLAVGGLAAALLVA
jgi:prepilin signal peptidase PulO-like enzyme (type II secretory pathway)